MVNLFKNKIVRFISLFSIIFLMIACSFISSNDEDEDSDIGFLRLDNSSVSISIGEMGMLNLSIGKNQKYANVKWDFDSSIISVSSSNNYGIVFSGQKEGSTTLTASCNGYSSTCVIKVNSSIYSPTIENPYIYCSQDYVSVEPGKTKKIYASAFGVSGSVLSSWEWNIDKSSVASLVTEGNYCWITGNSSGVAKLTVSNSAVSSYSYSVIINVSDSGKDFCYITTNQNVITMNLSESNETEFSVSLKNPSESSYDNSLYEYSLVDSSGKITTSAECGFSVVKNYDKFNITASKTGICKILITHPLATYGLEVLVRAETNADLSYVNATTQSLLVSSEKSGTVSFSVVNSVNNEYCDPSLFSYSFSDNYEDYVSCLISGGATVNQGDTLTFTAKKNGIVKVTAKHPKANICASVVVVVRNVNNSSSSATTYITTSQNYISTTTSSPDSVISVSIMNAISGRENLLNWNIESKADDGSRGDVIQWISGTGTHSNSSRMAVSATYNSTAQAIIRPLKNGKATIILSHPDSIYDTKITVVVKDSISTVSDSIVLNSSTSIIKLVSNIEENEEGEKSKYSSSCDVTVFLNSSLTSIDEKLIKWSIDCDDISLIANGFNANLSISKNLSKSGTCFLTVSYPNAVNELKIPVLYAATEEELESLKVFYSTSPNYNSIFVGDSLLLCTSSQNLSENDFISWTILEGKDSISLETNGNVATVKGLSYGKAIVKANIDKLSSIEYTIKVNEYGFEESLPSYLTTLNNVVYLEKNGDRVEISISGENLSDLMMRDSVWSISSSSFKLLQNQNGKSATIEALTDEGEADITISNKHSENELTIKVRVGNKYVFVNEDFSYISLSDDAIKTVLGNEDSILQAVVVHTENDVLETSNFDFEIADTKIATVSYSMSKNTAFISPKSVGSTTITVKHDGCQSVSIPILVSSSYSESGIPYITTDSNVVTVIEGETSVISCSLKNISDNNPTSWHWKSSDNLIASVSVDSGNSTMISANSCGTINLTVSNDLAPYPLNIVVIVIDKKTALSHPYISLTSNVITIKAGSNETISASMIGGKPDDNLYFSWTTSDSSIAFIKDNNENVYIRGMKSGTAVVTVSNSRYTSSSDYSKRILVRVDNSSVDDVFIKTSAKIVKLSPSDTIGTTITAELVNGEVLDSQDFYWSTSDESLFKFSYSGNVASIIPNGKTGSAYIYASHNKSLSDAEIIVLISDYDSLSFENASMTITQNQIYFVNMNLPAVSDSVLINYSSSNPSILQVCGTENVCLLQGIKSGSTVVKATLVDENGSSIQSAEMSVIVEAAAASDTVISTNRQILVLNKDESETITATVNGSSIPSNASSTVVWSWAKDYGNEITLLSANGQSSVKGETAYITVNKTKSDEDKAYILNCTYPTENLTTSVLIQVPKDVKKSIVLDKTTIRRYKDDGSFTINATVKNGTNSDVKNIEWSSTKYNGSTILTHTNSGGTCKVSATSSGNSVLTARLPNGIYAQCFIIIEPSGSIDFDTQTIHVTPGLSETVGFSVIPEGSTNFNWMQITGGSISSSESVSDYWNYSVNYAEKTVTISAKKAVENGYAGQLAVYSTSGSTSSGVKRLNVYSEYSSSLETSVSSILIHNPDTNVKSRGWKNGAGYDRSKKEIENFKKERTFTYEAYPYNMDVSVSSSDESKFSILSNTFKIVQLDGRTVKKGEVTIQPHSEFLDNANVILEGSGEGYKNQKVTIPVQAYYEYYPIVYDFPNLKAGGYSYVVGNNDIHLTDGEEVDVVFDVDRNYCENASVSFKVESNFSSMRDNSGTIPLSDVLTMTPSTSNGTDGNVVYKLKHTNSSSANDKTVKMSEMSSTNNFWKVTGEAKAVLPTDLYYSPGYYIYSSGKYYETIEHEYEETWDTEILHYTITKRVYDGDSKCISADIIFDTINQEKIESYNDYNLNEKYYTSGKIKGSNSFTTHGWEVTPYSWYLVGDHHSDCYGNGTGHHYSEIILGDYVKGESNGNNRTFTRPLSKAVNTFYWNLKNLYAPDSKANRGFSSGERSYCDKQLAEWRNPQAYAFNWNFLNGYMMGYDDYYQTSVSSYSLEDCEPYYVSRDVLFMNPLRIMNVTSGDMLSDGNTSILNWKNQRILNQMTAPYNNYFAYTDDKIVYHAFDSKLSNASEEISVDSSSINTYLGGKINVVLNAINPKAITNGSNLTVSLHKRGCTSYAEKWRLYSVKDSILTDNTTQKRWYKCSYGEKLITEGKATRADSDPDWWKYREQLSGF